MSDISDAVCLCEFSASGDNDPASAWHCQADTFPNSWEVRERCEICYTAQPPRWWLQCRGVEGCTHRFVFASADVQAAATPRAFFSSLFCPECHTSADGRQWQCVTDQFISEIGEDGAASCVCGATREQQMAERRSASAGGGAGADGGGAASADNNDGSGDENNNNNNNNETDDDQGTSSLNMSYIENAADLMLGRAEDADPSEVWPCQFDTYLNGWNQRDLCEIDCAPQPGAWWLRCRGAQGCTHRFVFRTASVYAAESPRAFFSNLFCPTCGTSSDGRQWQCANDSAISAVGEGGATSCACGNTKEQQLSRRGVAGTGAAAASAGASMANE